MLQKCTNSLSNDVNISSKLVHCLYNAAYIHINSLHLIYLDLIEIESINTFSIKKKSTYYVKWIT